MAILRMVRNAIHISEFAPSSWNESCRGTCTWASAAMALASAQGHPTTQQGVIDLMLSMKDASFKRGECAANGAATISAVAKELRNRGADIAVEWDYQGDHLPEDWHDLIKDNAGIRPLVVQIADAFMLYDIGGTHEDQGVHYHCIELAGEGTQGYVTGDPNNPTVMQTFDIYPYSAQANDGKQYGIAPASPCGLIMLNMQDTPTPQPSGGSTVSLPSGWTLSPDEQTLTGPVAGDGKQYTVVGTMRDYVIQYLANGTMRADDMPLEEEQHSADGNRIWQTFNYHRWVFERATTETPWSFFASNIGAALLKGERQIESDAQQIAAADTLVQELQAKLSTQPTPTPTPSPLGEQLIALIRQAAQGGN